MKKRTKIILIIIISLISLLVLLLLGAFIISSNYNFVCTRDEGDVTQNYSYEFNLIGKVKKFTYQTELLFENKESASEYYNKIISLEEIDISKIALNKNIVILDNTHPEQELGNNIFDLRKIHIEIDYVCEVIKK